MPVHLINSEQIGISEQFCYDQKVQLYYQNTKMVQMENTITYTKSRNIAFFT